MDERDNDRPTLASRRDTLLHLAWLALSAAGLAVLGRAGGWMSHALALPTPAFCYLTQLGAVMFLSRTWTIKRRWPRRPWRWLRLPNALRRQLVRSALIRELMRYVVVGASTTLLDFALLNLLLLAFPEMPPLALGLASGSTYALSLIVAYYWHRRWTFRTARRTEALAWRFVALNVSTVAINALATVLLTMALPVLLPLATVVLVNISKASATLLSGGLNFTGNRFWVFQSSGRRAAMPGAQEAQADERLLIH
ncbi:MAG TPA: GtrA family protein [Herpetosiphonaceae bacterium]|nr:GtrA family protein [Herpetosiphonaceae bacterium]